MRDFTYMCYAMFAGHPHKCYAMLISVTAASSHSSSQQQQPAAQTFKHIQGYSDFSG
jgi:hypothetical protein